MPFNGSGVYSPPSSPGAFNPAISGQSATPSAWNTLLLDIKNALSTTICRDGQSAVIDDIPFGGNKITALANATLRDDAPNAGQVQDGDFTYAEDIGSADAIEIALTPALAAYSVGQVFTVKVAHTNLTTTPTLEATGLTPGMITLPNGGAVAAGALAAGAVYEIVVSAVVVDVPTFQLLTSSSSIPDVLTTRGDLLYRGASAPTRLGIGSSGQVLSTDGTDPQWTNPTAFPAGVVAPYAGATPPAGWILCYGQSLVRTDFAALFAAIGTTFGAADGTHFNVPDLRGRAVFGVDNMGGTPANRLGSGATGGITGTASLGASGGQQSHTMTTSELVAHTHGPGSYGAPVPTPSGGVSIDATLEALNQDAPAPRNVAITGASGSTGSTTPFNVLNPAIVLNYIIST